MTDIVRRLRKVFSAGPTHGTFRDPVPDPLCNEAADEIERLQSLLEAANAYGAGENKARVEDRELLTQMMIRQSLATGHYRHSSASVSIVFRFGPCRISVVAGASLHAPSWSRIRSFGPSRQTASQRSSGTAATASFF